MNMNALSDFEDKLMSLNPTNDDFVLAVDTLIESVPEEAYEQLIPTIFRFFERYPLDDCGAPGTLVHLTERFYPGYKHALLKSLQDAPSFNVILMTNRILNSQLSPAEREEYLGALAQVANRGNIHPQLVAHANEYIEYQSQKNG